MVPVKFLPVMSDHVLPSWPRIDTRGVRYPSRSPARLNPPPRLASEGALAPTDPPIAHMPVSGTRRCANAGLAPIENNDNATMNRRNVRILSISSLSLTSVETTSAGPHQPKGIHSACHGARNG